MLQEERDQLAGQPGQQEGGRGGQDDVVGPVASQLGHGTRIRVGGHDHITGRGGQDSVVTDLLVVDGTLNNFDRS